MTLGKSEAAQKNALDGVAIGVSLACIVHCLLVPVLIAFLPAWSTWLELPEAVHFWLLAFALPFSLVVLVRAARKRFWFGPLWVGVGGLALMSLGLSVHDARTEAAVTALGAALLALAHVMNWRLRHRRC